MLLRKSNWAVVVGLASLLVTALACRGGAVSSPRAATEEVVEPETATSEPTLEIVSEPTQSEPTQSEPTADEQVPDEVVEEPAEVPVVYQQARFETEVTTQVYGQGLSHDGWGSETAEPVDLLLDVYEPVDAPGNRPAMVAVHGGGYVGGSRQGGPMGQAGTYFSERGWVVVSIDYRVLGDYGTVPLEWQGAIELFAPAEQSGQALAIYPASRDAKAAVRWLYANADRYQINTDYITALGGSAGAGIAVMLGTTSEEQFRDELTLDDDPTLASTNLDQPAEVRTIVNFWGASAGVEALETIYGVEVFDPTDAPVLTVHGTADRTVEFDRAEYLQDQYEETGVYYELYPLEGAGHGAWGATVDGMNLAQLAYNFIVAQQGLTVGE